MNIDHGPHGFQCFRGRVTLTPTGLIGATVGNLNVQGFNIPVRQIPGPAVTGIPLSQADGQFVRLCGQFMEDQDGFVLSVLLIQPANG